MAEKAVADAEAEGLVEEAQEEVVMAVVALEAAVLEAAVLEAVAQVATVSQVPVPACAANPAT